MEFCQPGRNDDEDRVRVAYGANYERLAAPRKKYDPDNFFRLNPKHQACGVIGDHLLRLLRGFKAKTASDLDGTMTIATQPLGDEEIGASCTTSRASPPSRSRPR